MDKTESINKYNDNLALSKEKEYWSNKLSGDLQPSSFRTSFNKATFNQVNMSTIDFKITGGLFESIMSASNKSDIGTYLILLTGVKYLLSKYSANTDVIVGMPTLKQNNNIMQLNNLLVLRTNIDYEKTYKELLSQTKNTVSEACKYQKISFEEISELLGLEDDGKNLIKTIVLLENIHNVKIIDDFKLDTVFSFYLNQNDIECKLRYNTDILDSSLVKQILNHFINFMQVVFNQPLIKLSDIDILSHIERKHILYEFNDTKLEYESDKTIQELFEEQVEKTPDNIAVSFEGKSLTYKELNIKANKIASLLLKKSIKSNEIVAIMLDRSVEIIVAILGILKSGAAYMPISPEFPQARINYMLQDSKAKAFITSSKLKSKAEVSGDILELDDKKIYNCGDSDIPSLGKSTDLAYLIYTSGTTGTPKGVMIQHKSVINLVAGLSKEVYEKYDSHLNVALVAPYIFDASVQQIFASLLLGHRLCIIPEDDRMDAKKLLQYYKENLIDVSDGTPTHINMLNSVLVSEENLNVRHFIIGGEALGYKIVQNFYSKIKGNKPLITNVYGPTECCVDSTYYLINEEIIQESTNIPIGLPRPNIKVYILDKSLKPVPVGASGEIFISGDCVARGYLNREDLNREKFIKNPFDSNKIMYRTGDLGMWESDGNIIFLGRIDTQVKIRGYRIELGEIENKILEYKDHQDNKNCLGSDDSSEVKFCKKCLHSSTHDTINEDGICNTCKEYELYADKAQKYFKGQEELKSILKATATSKKSEYDCLLLYSGGKDSSYVLYKLVEMGLKVLAFTFDNGFISDSAFENIKRVTSQLKLDSIIYKAENMNEIFCESLKADSTVCTGCFKALTSISTKIAIDKGINLVITGLSRGQIFDTKLHGLFQKGIFDEDAIEKKLLLFRKLYHSINDKTSQLLNVNFDNIDDLDKIYFIDYYRYENISSTQIKKYLEIKDAFWNSPSDTGFCSTNCVVNDVGIYTHLKEKGFHNYAEPLSWECRLGQITKEEGMDDIRTNFDINKINKMLDIIGYKVKSCFDTVVINDVKVIDINKEDKNDNKYLCAYIVSNIDFDISDLREYLTKHLPNYMIPSYFIRLEKIPLTLNGKIDRKSLPDPQKMISDCSKYVAPSNDIEKRLANIWEDTLNIKNASIDSNFFELGGNSLKITNLVNKIYTEFNVRISFSEIVKLMTIRKLAKFIKSKETDIDLSITPAKETECYKNIPGCYLASIQQQSMFILNQVLPDSTVSNVPRVKIIKGKLDVERFMKAFDTLIMRHEAFRTSFELMDQKVVQRIHEKVDFSMNYVKSDSVEIDKEINKFIKPFDLSKAPLLRVKIFELKNDEIIFMMDINHIISDAVSLKIIFKELNELYNLRSLPKPKFQYKDYSLWQKKFEQTESMKKQENYWLSVFKGNLPSCEFPLDYPRPEVRNYEGETIYSKFSKKLTKKINDAVLDSGTTLYIFLLSGFNVLLSMSTGRDDIVIGSPILGREYMEFDNVIGACINTLAMRNFPSKDKTLSQLLMEVKNNSLKAYENQDYHFEKLIEKLDINRKLNRNPLFDTMFVVQDENMLNVKMDGFDFIPIKFNHRIAKFDIQLEVMLVEDEIQLKVQYNTNIFKKETIKKMISDYVKIMEIMAGNLNNTIGEIKL